MKSPQQLVLDLPQRPALGRDDFLVAPSNQAAVALVDDWPNWPSHAAILVGPEGSGKSHLAHVWQAKSGARIAPFTELTEANAAELLASGALCLEKGGASINETALFHALNLARQAGGHILITATDEPARWNVKLRDLASRLAAVPLVAIAPPDDALLRGVLVKLFADRQVAVDEALISYMLTHMPRSLAEARRLVAEIDARALEHKAEITRAFVARLMNEQPQLDL